MNVARYSMLGIHVDALEEHHLGEIVLEAVRERKKIILANHNLHSIYLYHHDERLRSFYEKAEYVHIDGMPIVWIGKLFGYPLQRSHRLTNLDFLPHLFSVCEKEGLRVFLLGSKPGVAERAAEVYRTWNPRLILGMHHGYFDASKDSEENRRIIDMINGFRPHLLLVGMGMPRQEVWLAENIDSLQVNVAMNQGAFMDYIAGEVPTPPRWMGRVGLEWLYRLASEPKRLWRRYILEPPFVLKLLLKEWTDRRPALKK
ncbi:WecB/TagA/CpsF family glycosyltransferase [Staphylospora marina]|uniref:WecB/TagA/CpsF family glycosyltransferase n=1 Tax=Staphylospora marina TaxID=2490858 RepID=UPI000F5BCB24|nr:WecB/TagA/CpsF family glycosyltransferase [Staphylospora marina]